MFDEIYFVMTFQWIFFLSFFIFDVIFVGTAGANVALVLLYIAQCLLIPHRSLSLFRLLVYRHSSPPFRRNRFKWAHVWKCSHINILTFPWVLF